MRTKITVAFTLLLLGSALSSVAQLHYQMMGMLAGNFLRSRIDQYETIPVVWKMEGTLQADLNDGINYILEDQPVQAEGSLTTVIRKDPTVWQATYYRGIARKLQQNYTGAIEDLLTTTKLNPKCYEAFVAMARCYVASKSFADAERAIKKAIQLDKNRAAAYFVKGWIEEFQNQNGAASFRESLKVDSLYHPARINLAITLLVINKDEAAAVRELNSVLTMDSVQQDALALRSVLVFEKNSNQSLGDLTKLIRVAPTNMAAFYLRGLLLTKMQKYDRAFSDFQTLIKSTATNENNFEGQQTWVDRKIDIQNVGIYTLTRVYGLSDDDAAKVKQAYCLIMTNLFDKSIAVLNSTSDPNWEPLCVYLKAVAHEHQGNHNQALYLYDKAISLDNTIADAYKKRGIYRQELKAWPESIKDFTTVLQLMPDWYTIYRIRGVSYYHSKKFDKAVADFSSYLARDTNNREVIAFRAQSYKQNNDRLHAYIDYANIKIVEGFNNNEMLHLVDSVLQQGDTTLALVALKSFINADPKFTKASVVKTKLHAKQNDWTSVERMVTGVLTNRSLELEKEDRAYFMTMMGIVMSRKNSHESAVNAFDAAVGLNKKSAFGYLERGKYWLAKDKAKATTDLKKAAALGDAEAKKLLAGMEK